MSLGIQKGEIANDYSDLGVDFWGGILVSIAGKEVLPEDEIQGRKAELADILPVPSSLLNHKEDVKTNGTKLEESAEEAAL